MRAKIRAEFALIPIFLSIAIYVFIIDQIAIWTKDDVTYINLFGIAMALGSVLMGALSDAFSRRATLLVLHALGLLFLTIFYFNTTSYLYLFLFGLVYNPTAVVRAGLIDNITTYSKIKLISFSFIVQFFPETFYFLYVKIPKRESFILVLIALSISFLICLFLFFDRRDPKIRNENMITKLAFFLPNAKPKAIFTFLAFIPTQLAYFISDNLLEIYSLNSLYYSILAFGSVIGASVSILYKKTPHIAALTITYGLCLAIAAIPVGAIFFYKYPGLDIPFMFVIMGSLLGFYVPFVYDIILHSVEKNFRGTGCGVLDFVYSGSSLMTLVLFKELLRNVEFSLVFIAIAFAIAVGFQRASEKNT